MPKENDVFMDKEEREINNLQEDVDHQDLSDVSTQNIFLGEFCAPGGYKHCGKACGDGLKYGGGKPINATDTCCRAHDRCWKNFGNGDKGCNNQLVSCVKGHKTAVAAAIRAIWG